MIIIPATHRFSAHCSKRFAWFTEIVFVKVCVCVCIYLPMFVRTHPREQNRLITVKAAFT